MTEQTSKTLTFTPELLEPVALSEAGRYILSGNYCCQPKFDGRRLAVWTDGRDFVGFNRRGQRVAVPKHVCDALRPLPFRSVFLDGEDEAGHYRVFDLLELDFLDLRSAQLRVRRKKLLQLAPWLKIAPWASCEREKRAMVEAAITQNTEGVVFKQIERPYMPGRQGVNVKLKLWRSATLRVGKKPVEDDHASFAVEALMRTSRGLEVWESVGTVGALGGPVPVSGTYVEVRYLNFSEGGRLYQPCYLGQRDDVGPEDCSIAQLLLKGRPFHWDEPLRVAKGDARDGR